MDSKSNRTHTGVYIGFKPVVKQNRTCAGGCLGASGCLDRMPGPAVVVGGLVGAEREGVWGWRGTDLCDGAAGRGSAGGAREGSVNAVFISDAAGCVIYLYTSRGVCYSTVVGCCRCRDYQADVAQMKEEKMRRKKKMKKVGTERSSWHEMSTQILCQAMLRS
jgi:hypothetical protein